MAKTTPGVGQKKYKTRGETTGSRRLSQELERQPELERVIRGQLGGTSLAAHRSGFRAPTLAAAVLYRDALGIEPEAWLLPGELKRVAAARGAARGVEGAA